ncbi:MAG TPA: esterase-like activity of phytase family protein [Ideonella sp.]|nr:esterase-like activity of phytase family protein [Ideonella sp.]
MKVALFLALLAAPLAALAQPVPVGATLAGKATLVLRQPLAAEPIQGFSSVTERPDGTYWALADTGHAARPHRADVQVVFHHVYIDWRAGRARLLSAEALRDPDRRLAFPIANAATPARLLTSADINVDAMEVVRDSAWFADDLGPWLIETDLHGRVLAAFAALVDGVPLDAATSRRGFGGLAASRDGRFLYAAFEGPLWSQPGWETSVDGRQYLRILEFDLRARQWTGRAIRYALEAPAHTLADLALLDAGRALVVERGPQFRRIYQVSLEGDEAKKLAFVDLAALDMAEVEGLELVAPDYLVLTSGARREFVLLRAPLILVKGAGGAGHRVAP